MGDFEPKKDVLKIQHKRQISVLRAGLKLERKLYTNIIILNQKQESACVTEII